jgi:hypothetical protein
LYLAQKKITGEICYFIRESYPYEDYFLSRDLIDLGPDPGRFIIYPGGNSFYIDEIIENRINLNTDPFFGTGMTSGNRLNEYLVRYVLMYFDYDYAPGSFMDEYLRQFINSRRDYRPPYRNSNFGLKEACAIFGQSKEELKKMSRKELTRQYRQKAQKLHPDKGGDHNKFVKLTEAYHELLRTKK